MKLLQFSTNLCSILTSYFMLEIVGCNLLNDLIKLRNPLSSVLGGSGKAGKLSLIQFLSANLENLTSDGIILSEGDIVVDLDRRKGVRDDRELWPDGVIPYIFHESVVEGQKKIAIEAMLHWEENTCLKFREKSLKDLYYVRFRSDTSGCWSSVGRKFMTIGVGQDISLGVGCSKFYTAAHEIGHTIGYYHEHSRSDRDEFVKILWHNVKPGMDVQFEIKNTRNEKVEYDYRSIMHYPAWAFSKNPLSKNVIVTKNPLLQYLIDEEKDSLSFRDIKLTNILYKCSEKCPNFHKTKCQNKGYLSPNKENGKYCLCSCPPGFYGEVCQFSLAKDHSYYGKQKCGGNITKEGIISTPNYPLRKQEFESCGYWIQAPVNYQVEVTFDDFSFCEPYDGVEKPGIQGKCLFESVEIRKSLDIYDGSIYCGEQIEAGTVMKSVKRDFIILIIADDQMKGRGLKARVKFIPQTSLENKNKEKSKTRALLPQRVEINQSQRQSQYM